MNEEHDLRCRYVVELLRKYLNNNGEKLEQGKQIKVLGPNTYSKTIVLIEMNLQGKKD